MKSIGIVRKVDELGRVVLPIELRRQFKIEVFDPIDIKVDGAKIILAKYLPRCVFCGDTQDVTEKLGKNICGKCLDELR